MNINLNHHVSVRRNNSSGKFPEATPPLSILVPALILFISLAGFHARDSLAAPALSPAKPITVEEPDDGSLRLLKIRVGSRELEGLLDAYSVGNIVLVPVGALTEAIDMGLKVEPEKGVIRGFVYRPEDAIFLDLSRNQIVIRGKPVPIDPSRVRIYPGDIYVDAALLSSWLPFKLDADLYSSTLTIRSATKLPFEERIERETRYAGLKARGAVERPDYPSYFEPYHGWSYPFMTATMQSVSTYNNKTGASGTNYNYSVHATGDLMRLETSMYLAGTNANPTQNSRLTFGRKDPDGRLLGKMNAREFSFGSINSPSSSLISQPVGNPVGAMVSSFPLSQQGEFDRHTFRGELPDGWEVEIYQNGALRGYINTPVNGQYVFENLPLFFGRNYFRLVFYGPQGQQREETHTFELSDSLVRKGKGYYRVVTTEDADGGDHSGVQYDYGLNDRLTLSTEIQGLTLGKDKLLGQPAQKRTYTRAGVRTLLGGMFISADGVADSSNGSMVRFGVKTGIGANTQLELKSSILNNFVSDAYPLLTDPLVDESGIDINTVIPPVFNTRIPISFGLKHQSFVSGSIRDVATNRLSMSFNRYSFSNSLTLVDSSGSTSLLTGQAQVSLRTRKFGLRGDVGYAIDPTSEITSLSVTMDNIHVGKGILSFGINQQLTNSVTQYSARYNRPVGHFAFNTGVTQSSDGLSSLSFGLTVGLGREPRSGAWNFDSRPLAGTGAVSARVFIDENQNGVFDADEKPIPGVAFKRNGSGLREKTNDRGIAFIRNLTAYTPTDISLSIGTLEDPSWSPSIEGVEVNPRPGAVALIDFPVLETGEIDGTVYLQSATGLRASSDVKLELINSAGKVVKTLLSAPDGFYVFEGIPPGKYLVRVSPEQISEFRLKPVAPIQVTISSKNPFISGMNIRLER